MPDLEPVSGDPFATTLTPVNGDPFAVEHAMDAINAQTQARRATMANMFRSTVGGPGTVAQPVASQTPGMWSDEDEARRLATEGAAADWAPHQALSNIGGGTPAAVEGALGSAGGKGIRAYHGSPHDFEKFDVGKIGTGEGAQVYGHGLYFAENPATAAQYRINLDQPYQRQEASAINALLPKAHQGSLDNARNIIENIRTALRGGEIKEPSEYLSSYDVGKAFEPAYKKAAEIVGGKSKMYEVNINADPEHFLDWDKPLSEQSQHVRDALTNTNYPYHANRAGMQNPTGGDLVSKVIGDDLSSSTKLREAGIPGIKYLDQGSRNISDQVKSAQSGLDYWKGVGDPDKIAQAERVLAQAKKMDEHGTSNYVVFHHDIVDILKKYGVAGLVAGGAAHFSTTPHNGNPFSQ